MKIPEDTRVRSYELTYVIPGDRTSVQVTSCETAMKALLEKHSATVLESEDWGKRELAYTIKHDGTRYTHGYYKHVTIEAPVQAIKDLDTALKLHDEIMRYLLVVAEKPTSDADEVTEQENDDQDRS